MLAGDLCLSVIPASAGDSGLFFREAYFHGSYPAWRFPLLVATGLLGMALSFFTVRASYAQILPQYRKTRIAVLIGGVIYGSSAGALHLFIGSLADWTSTLSPLLGREEASALIAAQYGRVMPALALGMAAHNNALGRPLPQPRHIVAVSPGEVPWNEEEKSRMRALNDRDVAIDYAFMVLVEKFMRHGQENVPDYMISGSRGNFTGVGDICFLYSADEVLYGALPDFEAACKRAGVPYTAFARPGMVHCYCMLPCFREAKEDFARITDILKR